MWAKADSGKPMNWQDALAWCETLETAGHADWHLPDAKQLQSIVDYTRAPEARDRAKRGPAIDPIFDITKTESYFWSSTTHIEGGRTLGSAGVYVCFGRSMGKMQDRRTGGKRWMDVHGAGAQRSDPKSGDPESTEYVNGRGPQGDDVRILNYVRAVRAIDPNAMKTVEPSTDRLPEHKRPEEGGRSADGMRQNGPDDDRQRPVNNTGRPGPDGRRPPRFGPPPRRR